MYTQTTQALISINGTLVIQLISFLVFLFIIKKLMYQPLRETIIDREEYIGGIHRHVGKSETDIVQLNAEMKEREAAVKARALDMQKELEEAGTLEADQIITAAREEIDAIKDKTQTEIDARIAEASRTLQQESEALAVRIIEKVLDRRLAG